MAMVENEDGISHFRTILNNTFPSKKKKRTFLGSIVFRKKEDELHLLLLRQIRLSRGEFGLYLFEC